MKFELDRASTYKFKGEGIDKKFNPRVEKINDWCERCFIDINSLEDLIFFVNEYGEIVLNNYGNMGSILIYDDHIE